MAFQGGALQILKLKNLADCVILILEIVRPIKIHLTDEFWKERFL